MSTHEVHHETTKETIKDGKVVAREHHTSGDAGHHSSSHTSSDAGHHSSTHSSHSSHSGTTAVAGSKMPSNEQARNVLVETEAAIKDTQKHPPSQLDEQGHRLLKDVEHLAHDQRRLIEDKNRGDLIQNIANEARLAVAELQKDLHSDKLEGVNRDAARQMADQATNLFEAAQQLLVELASSQSFRQDMTDLLQTIAYILQDVTGVDVWQGKKALQDTANKAKEVVHSTAANVADKTSSSHSSGHSSHSSGHSTGHSSEHSSGHSSHSSGHSSGHTSSGHHEGGHVDSHTKVVTTRDDVAIYGEGVVVTERVSEHSSSHSHHDSSSHHGSSSHGSSSHGSTSEKVQDVKETAQHAGHQAKQAAGEVMQQGREKAYEVKDNVAQAKRDVHREGTAAHQDLNELIDRLSQIMYNISSRPQSKQVVKGLLDMVDLFTSSYAVNKNTSHVKDSVQSNVHLQNLIKHIRVFLERFAGKRRVDKLIGHAKAIQDVSTNDSQVQKYFSDVRRFLLSNLEHPKRGDEIRVEVRGLIDRGRTLAERKDLKEHFVGVIRGQQSIIKTIANDPQVLAISRDIRQFIADLTFDSEGNFNLNTKSLQQLKVVLVAALIERLTISIPSISSSDEKMDFEVSNIYLTLKDVVPDRIQMEYRGNMDIDTKDLKELHMKDNSNQIIIKIHNINFTMKDLNVYFKRKTFPKAEDTGKLTIDMPGDGLDLDITLNVRPAEKEHVLTAQQVDCTIDKLKLHLSETKHDTLYNTFLKLAGGTIKKRVQTKIEEKIVNVLDNINVEISRQVVNMRAQGGKLASAMNTQVTNVANKAVGSGTTNVGERREDVVVHHEKVHHS